jgi:hypothetical protein
LTWRRGSGWCLRFRRGGGRVEGSFPPGSPRGMHTGAPWLSVHASRRPDHPITRARWCGAPGCGAVRSGAEEEREKVRRKKREKPTCGSHTSAREEKEKRGLVSWAAVVARAGPAG